MALNEGMTSKFGVTYQPGQIIFLEYEPGDSFFLIQSGRVKITKVVKDKEKLLDILEPGDVFGEMAILEDAPRSASAVAADEVKALLFRKENFEIILKSNPAMALKLLKIFAKRIYEQKRRLMIFTLEEDDAKVLDVLLMLAEQKGDNPNSIESVELVTNEEQIASWAAIKVENCRKVLTHYDKLGRIQLGQNKVSIRNINEIHRMVATKRKQQ
ncbi:MAG TPA: Crp/Fnr family transcriptional regulator [Spirochaetota bacterium]|nr:Crp/Fnr family transcriptional regulator [Spirochaetota bacterium]